MVWKAAAENSFCPFHPCIIRSCSLRLAEWYLDVLIDYGCFFSVLLCCELWVSAPATRGHSHRNTGFAITLALIL
jgi:hypothetical protein